MLEQRKPKKLGKGFLTYTNRLQEISEGPEITCNAIHLYVHFTDESTHRFNWVLKEVYGLKKKKVLK